MTFSIVLKHLGGELKTVQVEYVSPNLSYLSIRWGQSGIYDLNLKDNKLTARSQKAQRKGKAHWKAESIETVRAAAKAYLSAQQGKGAAERDASIKRHIETMPNPRIGDETPDVRIRPQRCVTYDEAVAMVGDGPIEPFPQYTGDPETD